MRSCVSARGNVNKGRYGSIPSILGNDPMAFVTCRYIGRLISASVTGPPPSIPFFAVSTAGVMLLYGVSAGLPPDGVREGRGRSNLIWRGCRACAKHHRAEMRPDPIHRPGRDAASGRGVLAPAERNGILKAPSDPTFSQDLGLQRLFWPALWGCKKVCILHRRLVNIHL
jgi:hypothetical protein